MRDLMPRPLPRTIFLLACLVFPISAQDLFDKTKLRDFYITFKQANWWQSLQATRTSHQDMKADLSVDGKSYLDIGIRVKGNTSSRVRGNKKPFNLTFDAFTPNQRLYGIKTLNLNNGYVDPTLTREVLSYEVMRNYHPTPRTGYVRVHLNNTFWGVYVAVEQPNKDFLREWFSDEDGDRYKGDPPTGARLNSATLEYRGSTASQYQGSYEIKTPTHPNAWTDLVNLCTKLNSGSRADIEKVLNVDRALWYLATSNVIHNMDSYAGGGHNYYMYFDPADGRMNMVAWDCNMSFGVFRIGISGSAYRLSPNFKITDSRRPLVSKLLAVSEFRQIYYAHIRTILDEWYDWDGKLAALNTAYQALIRSSVAQSPHRLYPLSYFDQNVTTDFRSGNYTMFGLKPLTDQRGAFLRSYPDINKPTPNITEVGAWPRKPLQGQDIWITCRVSGSRPVKSVNFRTSVTGPFVPAPMFDDGQHHDGAPGDGIYGGSFKAGRPGEIHRYYVIAADDVGTLRLHPRRAEHEFHSLRVWNGSPTGPVLVNEVVADNETGDKDQAGDNDDWFELHNRSQQSQDISGQYLTDDPSNPKKWKLPPNSVIPAGGFLRIWADEEVGEGPYHASFKLSKKGELIALHDTDAQNNRLLDLVVFGNQKADRAFARVPDGGDQLFYVWRPTGASPLLSSRLPFQRYDARRTGSPTDLELRASGSSQSGQVLVFNLTGGAPRAAAAFGLAAGPGAVDLGSVGTLAIDPASLLVAPLSLDAKGAARVSFSVPKGVSGVTLYFQAAQRDLSNAVAVLF
ncbi:MAG: CotH kinase family protein [Planctomycetota bacterium]|nr:CotH kinase family protein [Planctomycetota bacterium]